jgi:hypothetical protein
MLSAPSKEAIECYCDPLTGIFSIFPETSKSRSSSSSPKQTSFVSDVLNS